MFPEIAGLKGDTGCRAIFGDHLENICKLDVDDAGILLDADRPQDLALLREIFETGGLIWTLANSRATETEVEVDRG